jgi:BirA family transcriptional regulator, biotin operon repressor / biotin---[acetyl-CoA-carboxylase] ligase
VNIGKKIIRLGTVDSTNTYAMELAEKGADHGTVVIADNQTKGKGRMGRTWVSPPGGNIYMSVILRPSMQLRDGTLLTITAGVACCRALRSSAGLQAEIKWPNDLMVSGRKAGGILTEIKANADGIIFAIMGIGINVNASVDDFPPDIKGTATSIRNETAGERPTDAIIEGVLNELDCWTDVLGEKGGGPVLDEWRRLTTMLGRTVSATLGGETLTGIAEDVDDWGMLVLRLPSGISRKINAGDLTILR